MRIGLFTDTYTPDINGVVSSIVTLQKELEKHGHDVFIITNHKAARTKLEGNVLRLPGMELKWLYGYKLSTPYHFSARDEIRKMQLDVIHVHTEFGVGMFGRIVAKYLNIPVVTTYHTMYEDYTHYVNRLEIEEVEKVSRKLVSSFSRMLSDSAQAVISPSEKTKETLLRYGVKTPIYVIPTGLNFDKFNRKPHDPEQIRALRQQYGIEDEDKVVVFVGRIAQEKSIDIPIEGFRYVKDPHCKLMIVGGGPQLEELKQLAKSYGIDKQVIFTDKKPSDEVPLYYACADCFVCASLTETQGMTFIEALACGLPVFARYDEVLKDLVIENDSGFLFENGQEFAQKLEAFFALPKEAQEAFHERAQAKIMKYDSEVFYSKVLSVYYQAIDDFEHAYEVIKIKTLDDHVRIYVENDKEDQPLKLLVSLEDYFTYKIRLHALLDRTTVAQFQHKEILLQAYRSVLRKLRIKDYTRKEIEQYLNRQLLAKQDIEAILHELEEKGYINDARYIQEKIERLQHSLTGKERIRRSLLNKGLDREAIEQALQQLDDEEEMQKAKQAAAKLMTTIKDTSQKMKRQKIMRKLISMGFDSDIAKVSADALPYTQEDELPALEKTLRKAYRTYSRRYEGRQLQNKIMSAALRKGFRHEDIIAKMEETEWKHE